MSPQSKAIWEILGWGGVMTKSIDEAHFVLKTIINLICLFYTDKQSQWSNHKKCSALKFFSKKALVYEKKEQIVYQEQF